MPHEMRTPLTTINGLLEGLQYNAIPENQKENAIKLMQNETARLIRLVNENLDYEKNSDQPDSNCCEEVQRNRSFRKYCDSTNGQLKPPVINCI